MKLVKTYAGDKALKHWQYDHKDAAMFAKNFKSVSLPLAERLCNYLKQKNIVVDVIECFDPQSGWRGFDFIVEKQNLSFNGYCFTATRLEQFLVENGA